MNWTLYGLKPGATTQTICRPGVSGKYSLPASAWAAGWYVMVPPLSETVEVQSDAPLAAWETKGAYDRPTEYRNAIRIGLESTGASAVARQIHVAPAHERDLLLKFVQMTRDKRPGRAQYVASLKREQPAVYEQIRRFVIMKFNHDQYLAAQCVASDDARLLRDG